MQAQNCDATKFEQRKVRKEQPREPTTHADEFRANRSHAGMCNVRGCTKERKLAGEKRDEMERDEEERLGERESEK
jgi:hypothetical protein